jgi:hypothetical protein
MRMMFAKRIVALIVVAVLLGASIWFFILKSNVVSAQEFYEDFEFYEGFKSYREGDFFVVRDRVNATETHETSYGTVTEVTMGSVPFSFYLLGDHTDTYAIGSEASIPIEINGYYFNDRKYIWAEETGIPGLYFAYLNAYSQAMSFTSGILLESEKGDDSSLNIIVRMVKSEFQLWKFNATLRQGLDLNDFFYYYYRSDQKELDHIDNLTSSSSENGLIEFNDKDDDGMLSVNDYFKINIPPTTSKTLLESYSLNINGLIRSYYHIVNWHKGFYFLAPSSMKGNYFGFDVGISNVTSNTCSTTIMVDRSWGEGGKPIENYSLDLYKNGDIELIRHPLTEIHSNLTFIDHHEMDILDDGDEFAFENLDSNASYSFSLHEDEGKSSFLSWTCKFGPETSFIPELFLGSPHLENISKPVDYGINVTDILGIPAAKIGNYEVQLLENGVAINAGYEKVVNGTILTSPVGSGLYLNFSDNDYNGLFNVNDTFTVENCKESAEYELRIYYGAVWWPKPLIATVIWQTPP